MSEIYDGGPAFPRVPTDYSDGSRGMTLRDWFAGQALATQYTQCETDPSITAKWAYQVADAMLEIRQKGE
ncbi:hypothetical protein UFOVP233_45 [uncultured Caudovirales phage]|uniref:Uncharacterized protein n=1 Tax=uncultured Caudovirales phage TaxID=2100421 RepID=A0A6J7WW04_9CAUD|nr:hypothetical protein UFOVP233_45 [uncultured Caudovirales phage]